MNAIGNETEKRSNLKEVETFLRTLCDTVSFMI